MDGYPLLMEKKFFPASGTYTSYPINAIVVLNANIICVINQSRRFIMPNQDQGNQDSQNQKNKNQQQDNRSKQESPRQGQSQPKNDSKSGQNKSS
ncbi:MAG: hypothetical protein K0R98_587 [Rickettsiaceae bacterium]|nr:hypothetical protein [Rickettsiaceae bacterium]